MKNFLLIIVFLSIIFFPYQTPAKEKIVLNFWQFSAKEDILRGLLDKFEEENPDIKVNMQVLTWDYGLDKIVVALAAKNAPDIFELGSTWTPQFYEAGALYELTEELSPLKEDYFFWDPVTFNAKLYGAPWLIGTRVLFYNKELFKKAGLNPANPPRTWEELLRYAKKINSLKDEIYGFGIYAGEDYTPWQEFLPFVWQGEGKVLSEDYTHSVFSSRETQEAFEFYKKLKKYSLVERQSQVNRSFAEGKIGMQISGAWNLLLIPNTNPHLNYEVALVPTPEEGGTSISFAGGEVLVINKSTEYPEACLRLLKFLLRQENIMTIVKAQQNVLPASKTSIKLPYYQKHPRQRVFFEQMKTAHSAPAHPKWVAIQKEVTRAIDRVVLKDEPIKQVLIETQSTITGILEKRKQAPLISDKILTGAIAIAVLAIVTFLAIAQKARSKQTYIRKVSFKKSLPIYIFLSPWLISFLIFGLYPLIYSIIISFSEYNLLSSSLSFIGLKNYFEILKEPAFLKALLNTCIFAIGTVPFTIIFALTAALLINRKIPLKQLFQAGLFLPVATSIIVIASIFTYLYSPDGLINLLLEKLGLDPPRPSWLMNTKLALPSIMAMAIWSSFGYYTILFLAGLQAIPKSLYEVSAIDGADSWQQLWHITLPQLKGIMLFVIVINTIRSFQVFPEIFTMTRGGPIGSTTTVVYYLYEEGFHRFAMGKASAVGYILFIIIMIFTLMQMKIFKLGQKMTY
jgi:multiple sugar transport system substrate-binding protein